MDPITTENSQPAVQDSIADPVVLLTVPASVGGTKDDEVYQLIFDFSTNKAVARMINLNPMMMGLADVLQHPDGIETLIWACLTQMGNRHRPSIPKDQLKIKITTVQGWLEDPDFFYESTKAVTLAVQKFQPKRKPEPQPEGENSENPPE